MCGRVVVPSFPNFCLILYYTWENRVISSSVMDFRTCELDRRAHRLLRVRSSSHGH